MKKLNDNWQYLLLIGATATGKTSLAVEIAKKFGAIIINCDSMQIYDALPILTAQPNMYIRQEVPHYLFSYVNPGRLYSVGHWLQDVEQLLHIKQKIIFVGGTGLYFNALLGNISPIPDIDINVRDYWRTKLATGSVEDLYFTLKNTDSDAATNINPSDGQRIVRALEVWHSTGKSITYWQKQKSTPILSKQKIQKYVIQLPKEKLYSNINNRVENMLEKGVIEEVDMFLRKNKDKNVTSMRAIGVSEFCAYLDGKLSLHDTTELVKTRTRQYAKRQLTWQRHQLNESWNIYGAI